MATVTTLFVLLWTAGSLEDPDVWWHVRTGRLIIDTHRIPHTDPWSFTAARNSWVPTAWLSDTLFGAVWKADGFAGIRLLRIAMAAVVVAVVYVLAIRSTGNRSAALLGMAVTVLALAPFLRERPQVLSFIFVAWLAWQIQRTRQGHAPNLLISVLVIYLWANVHGMWALAPLAFVGAGVLSWWDDRSRIPVAARCTSIAILGLLSTALTPVGPRLTYWPLVVQRIAGPISEWQPTLPTAGIAVPFVIILVSIVVRWARSADPVPTTTVVYVIAVGAFGFLAYRNIAPASILLLPELVARVEPASAPGRRQLMLLPRLPGVVLLVAICAALIRAQLVPLLAADQPSRIVADLAARPHDVRVLNWYSVGGLITGTASPPAHVAIDGRADIWSKSFIRNYVGAVSGDPTWRELVTSLRPDVAVLPKQSEVARGLVVEMHWRITEVDGSWVLLERPR